MILFDKRHLLHKTCSVAVLLNKEQYCYSRNARHQVVLNAMKFLRRLSQGLQSKCRNNSLLKGTAVNLFRGKEKQAICFSKQIFTVSRIYHRLPEPTRICCVSYRRSCIYFFGVFNIFPRSRCCDTSKICYIFKQIFPFQSGLRKDEICALVIPPSRCFLSPLTFCEARDQPEPGLSH